MSEIKTLEGVEIKNANEGRVKVRFATYDEVDLHGDVTKKGAFDNGQEVVVSSYNHQSWGSALPVGKGRIQDGRDGAYADLQFFMNTQAGRDTFETVKEVGSLQQWSYGFDIEQKSNGTIKSSEDDSIETPVRYLEKVKVHEISPVLLGAGKSTGTVAVKAHGFTVEEILEALELKAQDYDKDKDKKPKNKDEEEKDEDDEEEDEEKKPKKPKNDGKMRMSDQTDDVVTSVKDLADRAEEIVALRKSDGKRGVSLALKEQFEELREQANRIFDLMNDDFVTKSDEQTEMQHIYLSLLSEEL